ncbi:MAG: hypothetical protein GX057_01485 [Clostridiales bacterium]|nr:hypothetical protein [Clostridiales bacterium]
MTDYTGKIKIYVYSSLILSLICTLLYCTSYLFFYEADIGYFKSSALLPVISGALTVTSVVFMLTAFITIPKGTLPAAAVTYGRPSKLAASVCAAGFLGYAAFRLLSLQNEPTASPPLTLSCIILSALSAPFFLIIAFRSNNAGGGRVFAGFFPIFWVAVAMSESYTNKLVAMNNPVKVSFLMAALAVMLFMLYELRYLLGRGMPRAFLVFTLAGIHVLAVFAVPTLLLAIAQIYKLTDISAGAVVCLLLGLYIAARLREFYIFLMGHTQEVPEPSGAENPAESLSEDV